jgi:1-acyl-sn-glycerol-3-phosphate acyltransferase
MRQWLARRLLALLGWRAEGAPPDLPKYVLVVAPHTSNWDFPVLLLLAVALGIKATWMGKHTLFRPPLGWLMRRLGGLPIDRTARNNVVEQAVESFYSSDRLILAILPEGTRKRTPYWKSGFYHIARGAGAPIALGYADFERKVGGIGRVLTLSGHIEADMATIRDFYSRVVGKRPEQFGPIRLKPQEADDPARAPSATG